MIPILDLKQQYLSIKDEIDAAMQEVVASSQFILGPAVKELEKNIAAYCECSAGVGVASGTDALRLALGALEIGPDDEVITTSFTFVATANTISHTGARPVFVDIDPNTFNLDASKVEAAITPRTRAIMPVHLYGHAVDMDAILDIAQRHNLKIIEDCAQAIGGKYKGRALGSLGDAAGLSFFPSKNLGAFGDAGMVVTNDSDLATKVDVLRRQGGAKKYYHEVLGFNSRLDTLQAAVLNVKLRYLDEWNDGRRRVAQRYNELLAGLPIETPKEATGVHHVYHQYTIRTPRRDDLQEFLKQQGVGTMVYYPVPLHLQPLYAEMKDLQLPEAVRAANEALSLPISPGLTEEDQQHVVESIQRFFA
ncbi:MAG TPA: DegT/DnrJ/EryC1/StrS family aminotransferase [Abditibacteriaceae bacterium]|jgi:dTDP-4-amino-4,6-dideoxygalactose transaminase